MMRGALAIVVFLMGLIAAPLAFAQSAVSASLTLNGQTSLSLPANASGTYVWKSTGGSQFGSALAIYNSAGVPVSSDPCGNITTGNWGIINNASGSLSASTAQCQVGYRYVITYIVTSASGQVSTANVGISVTAPIAPPVTIPVASPVVTPPTVAAPVAPPPAVSTSSSSAPTPTTLIPPFQPTPSVASTTTQSCTILRGGLSDAQAALAKVKSLEGQYPGIDSALDSEYQQLEDELINISGELDSSCSGISASSPAPLSHQLAATTPGSSGLSASLTLNGQTSLSVPANTAVTYAWNSQGGSVFASSLGIYNSAGTAVPEDGCGNKPADSWVLAGASGSLIASTTQCQIGYDYVITYTALDASGDAVTSTASIVVTPGAAATPSSQFPMNIMVTVPSLNVRSAPNTSASLAGSQVLSAGDEFTAVNEVTGESVDGNDLWWVSSDGNYVWSGGTTVSDGPAAAAALPKLPAPVTMTVTSGGVSYPVTYTYLADGEVRATFTYKNKSYAVQNYNVFGAAGGIALIQSNGSFGFPWTGQADMTLWQLASQISINVPANQTIFSGFTFVTPLYYYDDVSPGYVSTPANAYGITKSTQANVALGLSYLDTASSGSLIGVTPVYISHTGVVTTGVEIMIQQPQIAIPGVVPTSPATISASQLSSEIMALYQNSNASLATIANMATQAGYLVYEGQDDSSLLIRDPVTNAVVAAIGQTSD